MKSDIQQAAGDIPVTFGVAIKFLEGGEELLPNNDRAYSHAFMSFVTFWRIAGKPWCR